MESNLAELCGAVLSELRFSHKTYGEIFYTFVLGIERRSGYIDEINIMVSERLIFEQTLRINDFVEIKGQVRTYNEFAEEKISLMWWFSQRRYISAKTSDIMKTMSTWKVFFVNSLLNVHLLLEEIFAISCWR